MLPGVTGSTPPADPRRAPSRRRRVVVVLAPVASLVAAAALVVAAAGGWSPGSGGPASVLDAVPGDADAVLVADAQAVDASPLAAQPELRNLLDEVCGAALAEGTTLTDVAPWIGRETAIAVRDLSWVVIVRVQGFSHALRLGAVRLAASPKGEGPVLEADAGPDIGTIHVARIGDLWIVSDDEDLALAALRSAQGRSARFTDRTDAAAARVPAELWAWSNGELAAHVFAPLHAAVEALAPGLADRVPAARGGSAAVTLPADAAGATIVAQWPTSRPDAAPVAIDADVEEIARAIDRRADGAGPPVPIVEPRDRVRYSVEHASRGLTGDELRAAVERSVEQRARERGDEVARAERLADLRAAALVRALGAARVTVEVARGVAVVRLDVGRR